MEQEQSPKILVFASGEKEPNKGGSGFEVLVKASRGTGASRPLKAEIVGVVSNHAQGGVYSKAQRLDVPFFHACPKTATEYQELAQRVGADWFMLSGWLKRVVGLPVRRTLNIHPGPAPEFGGPGLYGHFVREAVLAAFKKGEIEFSAVTMHFVTPEYDQGPICLKQLVPIQVDDTPETLAKRVNGVEHQVQPMVTNMVVTGEIECVEVAPQQFRVKAPPYWLRNFVPEQWWY